MYKVGDRVKCVRVPNWFKWFHQRVGNRLEIVGLPSTSSIYDFIGTCNVCESDRRDCYLVKDELGTRCHVLTDTIDYRFYFEPLALRPRCNCIACFGEHVDLCPNKSKECV